MGFIDLKAEYNNRTRDSYIDYLFFYKNSNKLRYICHTFFLTMYSFFFAYGYMKRNNLLAIIKPHNIFITCFKYNVSYVVINEVINNYHFKAYNHDNYVLSSLLSLGINSILFFNNRVLPNKIIFILGSNIYMFSIWLEVLLIYKRKQLLGY